METNRNSDGRNAMNLWNQKPYFLNPANGSGNYQDVFETGASNSFWLEPAVYFGPPIEVADIEESAGALCYRIQFNNGDMSDEWRGLYFFPRGYAPLSTQMGNDGNPKPVANTERLQAKTTLGGVEAVISLYVDTAALPPGGFRVQVSKGNGGPGGGGWGGGHN
jgi:hypothetical protein